jgi:c-di-GMP-related signal transduction protein
MDRFVARQPIFDRSGGVAAYELLFRSGMENYFHGGDGTYATSRVIHDTLHLFGLDALTGSTRAYINVGRELLVSDLVYVLPAGRITVEILETVPPDPEVIRACRALKSRGYELALDDFVFLDGYGALVDLADVIKVDFRQTLGDERRAVVERHRRGGLRFLAEKVESAAERDEAAAAGYTLFQGYFFCRPEMVTARELSSNSVTCLRLMQAAMEPTIDFEQLERQVRSDAALTIKLLRYLNSAGMGVRREVTSIRQAMVLLGERPLRRWIALLAMASIAEESSPQVMTTAFVRAVFCERLAARWAPPPREGEAFLAGLLSLADAMLGRPMIELLGAFAVTANVRGALLGEGPLAPMLTLATAYERGDWAAAVAEGQRQGLDEAYVAAAYEAAVADAQRGAFGAG